MAAPARPGTPHLIPTQSDSDVLSLCLTRRPPPTAFSQTARLRLSSLGRTLRQPTTQGSSQVRCARLELSTDGRHIGFGFALGAAIGLLDLLGFSRLVTATYATHTLSSLFGRREYQIATSGVIPSCHPVAFRRQAEQVAVGV